MKRLACIAVVGWLAAAALAAGPASKDWPTVRGDPQRTGYVPQAVLPPYKQLWVAEFPREILTTRVEAIVADGKVFVGTQNGTMWALNADTGKVEWKKPGFGPILHSPAVAGGKVFFGDAARTLYALDTADGSTAWTFEVGKGGFAAAPLVIDGVVYIGSRDGTFHAIGADDGKERWTFPTGGPIRCTAAYAEIGGKKLVVFASDDMYAYAIDVKTGKQAWKSDKLFGQSFRDYYPVVVEDKVIFRSVLVAEMNQDLNGGTQFLMNQAGVKSLDWGSKDSFAHSDQAEGTPELHRREQKAINKLLSDNKFRRTCFILDADSGRETVVSPVMYAAGNQGCGFPPTVTADGRVIIFYRTAYGRWQLGVKPAVGVGYLDIHSGWIEPIHHVSGAFPPWNTFWGTSDESTMFSVGGGVLYICHQGSLGALELKTRRLMKVIGERDTWGGIPAPGWAANEWHGPARGSAAIVGDRLYYVTGSRVLCVQGKEGAGQ